jgi:hypothetical protein
MPLTRSRYDGHAEWYDSWNKPNAERNAADLLVDHGELRRILADRMELDVRTWQPLSSA